MQRPFFLENIIILGENRKIRDRFEVKTFFSFGEYYKFGMKSGNLRMISSEDLCFCQ